MVNYMSNKICPKCGLSKLESEFRYRQRSEDNSSLRTYTNCKSCEHKINTLLIKLKKENNHNRPILCDCCGKESKLHLDHCHKTNSFRGWLCNNCNVGISRLGDNIEGVVQALNYLLERRK